MYQEYGLPVNIGDYETIRPIARGLTSEVFLARSGNLFYAVKVLDGSYAKERRRFRLIAVIHLLALLDVKGLSEAIERALTQGTLCGYE